MGDDILVLTASSGNDNLILSKPAGNDLKVERVGGTAFEADDVEEVSIDLGAGADTLKIKRMAGTLRRPDRGQRRPDRHRQRPRPPRSPTRTARRRVVPIVTFADDGQADVITIEGRDDAADTFTISAGQPGRRRR